MEIANYLNKHQNPVVACSFGKDSLVVLDMVRRIQPDIPVVFNNTGVEYPDTLKLRNRLKREWNLNLIEVRPLEIKPSKGSGRWTFWKVVERYGFPIGQRRGATATGKCCYRLKKAPMKRAMKQHGWDLVIDGMTIVESRQRYLQLHQYVDVYGYRYNKAWGCHKLSPILNWTPGDVWDYIEKYNLPYNKYYDNEIPELPSFTKRGYREKGYWRCLRVGCWACTIPLKYDPAYLMHMRKFYPKLHEILLRKGLAEYLLNNSDGLALYRPLGAKWMVENRPCEFDGITVETKHKGGELNAKNTHARL